MDGAANRLLPHERCVGRIGMTRTRIRFCVQSPSDDSTASF